MNLEIYDTADSIYVEKENHTKVNYLFSMNTKFISIPFPLIPFRNGTNTIILKKLYL